MYVMELLCIFILVSVLAFSPSRGQTYPTVCGIPLQDVPNPSSDTCTAFFRCFNLRKYSLRCPLGQAFHFDRARCRPEADVDCPLQLQRFQAPPVPPHLRSPQAPQEREVEIRVVHVAPGVNPNNLQIYSNGQAVTGSRQPTAQRGGHTLIAAQQQHQQQQQQQQQNSQPLNVQQTPIFLRSPDGQVVQGQTFTPVQGQVLQGQSVQGQPGQGLVFQSQPDQGQINQGQQPAQGFYLQQPAQAPVQFQG